jgi:hypothetical protein
MSLPLKDERNASPPLVLRSHPRHGIVISGHVRQIGTSPSMAVVVAPKVGETISVVSTLHGGGSELTPVPSEQPLGGEGSAPVATTMLNVRYPEDATPDRYICLPYLQRQLLRWQFTKRDLHCQIRQTSSAQYQLSDALSK